MSTKPPAKLPDKSDVLTVFLTGSELGALKPCGCSGGQLGGLDRRSAILNSVPVSKRLIVDTGAFVEETHEQDLIKFNIIIQAFDLLDYDLVNLTGKDLEIARQFALLDSISSLFDVISSRNLTDVNVPAKFTKQFSLKGKTTAVTVAAFDPVSAPIEQLRRLFKPPSGQQTANILILESCTPEVIASVAERGIVDCLVCPAESDEPMVIGDPNKRPLVISAGRLGKYVGRLQIEAGEPEGRLKFGFSAIAVTEDLPQQQSQIELYKTYQQFVKEANLLESQPRFALPQGMEYIGSKACKSCHEYEYVKWSAKAHARAYATLEKVGSQFDPECIGCHVVGFDYESGFICEAQSSEDLKNVGCENCHGPGSQHLKTAGKAHTTDPQSYCTDCHTPDNSAGYAANEQQYFQKIIHWREPNAPADVK